MNGKSVCLVLCLVLASCSPEPEGLSEHRQEVDTLVAEVAFHGENLGKAITSLELLTEEISITGDTTAEELAYYKTLQENAVSNVENDFRNLSELTPRLTTATALLTKREDFLPFYAADGKYHGHAVRLHESAAIAADASMRAAQSIQNSKEAIDALGMRSTSETMARLEELEVSGMVASALDAQNSYMAQLTIAETAYLEYKKTSIRSRAWKAKADFWQRQESKRAELVKPWLEAKRAALEGEFNVRSALIAQTAGSLLSDVDIDTSDIEKRLEQIMAPLYRAIEEEDEAWARYDAL